MPPHYLQVRPSMPPTVLLTSLSSYASLPCKLATYSPTPPIPTHYLQARPPMLLTYNNLIAQVRPTIASSPSRLPTYSPTSSSTHASYVQFCPTMPLHPVGCQPTALQVSPPMPPTCNFVQLCLFTL